MGAGLFFGSIDSKCKERLPVVNPPFDIVGTKVSVGISVGCSVEGSNIPIVGCPVRVTKEAGVGIDGAAVGVGEREGMEVGIGV